MIRKTLLGLLVFTVGGFIGAAIMAQSQTTKPGRYLSMDEIVKNLKAGGPLGISAGETYTIVPGMVMRRRVPGPNDGSIHSTETDGQNVTEIVQIVDGGGTFMIGGKEVDDNPDYTKKDRNKGIVGGVEHEVHPGDFFVIPPGTAHWFEKIDGHVSMIETRFPGDVTKGQK